MKCEVCGQSPHAHGITLLRQNAKGEIGIWRCEACNEKKVPPDVAEIVAVIQRANREAA